MEILEYLIQDGRLARIKVLKVPYVPEAWNSSPASHTKETVERLSLFLSVDPGQNRYPPWNS